MQLDLLKCLSFSEILSNYAVLQIFSEATAIELGTENTLITTLTKILSSLAMPNKKILIFSFLNIKFLQFLI